MNEKINAAAYIRVSTKEQAEEGYSIGAQTEKLTKYIDALDLKLYKNYIDAGHSGAKLERPALQEMIHDIESGLISTVVVLKLDRLARSQKITLHLIEDIFDKNGVAFISMQESFDTSTPFGRATVGMLSVFAQLERDTITERMLSGRIERAKSGLYHGGSNVPLGYDYKDGELLINPFEAQIVNEIYRRYLDGESQYSIYVDLDTKYPNMIYGANMIGRILSNSTYIGKIAFRDGVYAGKHDAIVSEKLFDIAQVRLSEVSSKYMVNKRRRSSLLLRKFFCQHCGSSMTKFAHYKKNGIRADYAYYTCSSKRKGRGNKTGTCSQISFRDDRLNEQVLSILKSIDYDEAQRKIIKKNNAVQLTGHNKEQLAQLEKQEKRLLDLYQFGKMDIDILNERLDKIILAKNKLKKVAINIESETVLEQLENLKTFDWETATFENQCSIVDILIKRVLALDEDVEVLFNF